MSDNMQRGEHLAIPVVVAIIEKEVHSKRYVLLQTRHKPKVSPEYTGLFEIPAGGIRAYEDIFETLKREIKEEVGLEVTDIVTEVKSGDYMFHEDHGMAFKPFCCVQMTRGAPFVGFVFLARVRDGPLKAQASEVRDPHWIEVSELKHLFASHPERFFTLEAGALELYLQKV